MEQFASYLRGIGIETRAFLERIEFLYKACCEMSPEKPKDIFVSNYIQKDGKPVYESLWFFSDGYCSEAKNFLTKYDIDITPIKRSITYWTVTMDNYRFQEKASLDSKLTLEFHLAQGIEGEFKSEGMNCEYLASIINNYVKPNLI